MKKYALVLMAINLGFIALRSQEILSIPYEVTGNLIIIQARINGQPGDFILDTGAEHLVLNQAYFRGRPSKKVFHHVLGSHRVSGYNYVDLEMGHAFSKKVYADILDLQRIEQARGKVIHGLIGIHVLRYFDAIYFDFKKQVLFLVKGESSQFLSYGFSFPAKDTLPFRWKGYMPVIIASLGGQSLPVALDTGAGMNLISDGEKDLLTALTPSGKRHVTLHGFGPDTDKRAIAKLRGMQVGVRPCPPLHFAFASLSRFNQLLGGKPIAGILHPQALGVMQMAIHFRNKEIYLWGDHPESSKPLLVFFDNMEDRRQ